VLGHWLREIRRWAPPIRVIVLHRASGQAFKEASSGGAAAVAARQRSSSAGAGNRIKHHAARAFVEQWITRSPPTRALTSDSDDDVEDDQIERRGRSNDDALGAVVSFYTSLEGIIVEAMRIPYA
jgi:hypothetical protein